MARSPRGKGAGARPDGDGPPRRAVALHYDRAGGRVPQVSAAGRGLVAEQILALAREHGIPVREDADLVHLLAACDVGDDLPVELYEAVAEVLTFLYRLARESAARAE